MASGQPISLLPDPPLSRAGSLLQGSRLYPEFVHTTETCGSWLASDGVRSVDIFAACPPLSRAGSLLQRSRLYPEFVYTTETCGSWLASDGIRSVDIFAACPTAIASRLTPTMISVVPGICAHH
ncbi:hypothetical protein C1893_09380 [Pseudomonas sp. MPR-ANC1]|nr:hypothetical protein C1893_09380 [Pseudomonas sp. MPR-ANC1]